MQLWLSDTFSDDEAAAAIEGKVAIIHGSKAEVMAIARFTAKVAEHLEGAGYCHMHLRDNMVGWSKVDHIDIEVTVDEKAA